MNAHDTMTAGENSRPAADRSAMPLAGRLLLSSIPAIATPGLLLLLVMLPPLVTDPGNAWWQGAFLIAGIAMSFAAVHLVVLGVPYVLVLRQIGRMRWLPMMSGGFATGFLPTFCFSSLPRILDYYASTGPRDVLVIVLWGHVNSPVLLGGFGALSALVFFLAFRWLSRGR